MSHCGLCRHQKATWIHLKVASVFHQKTEDSGLYSKESMGRVCVPSEDFRMALVGLGGPAPVNCGFKYPWFCLSVGGPWNRIPTDNIGPPYSGPSLTMDSEPRI